jgi:hypothetical protein
MKEQVFETLWISKYLRERDKSRKYVYIYIHGKTIWKTAMLQKYGKKTIKSNIHQGT